MQRELLRQRLREEGLGIEEITHILLTHCHSDHICNFPFFPNAETYVSAADLSWALRQPVGTWFIPELHVERLHSETRTHRISPGDNVLPGVRALDSPGHTPGHVSYAVEGVGESYLFCGDAAKNQAELATGKVDMTLDDAASRQSIEKIREMAVETGALIVPGHDRLLSYDGAVHPRTRLKAGIAARLSCDFEMETVFSLADDEESMDSAATPTDE
jgi:glyoxylase-like metal-dependent hydrolase (beta-lactamase superfamily II)